MLHLFNTLYVPATHTNLFSLQRMRKAKYKIVQDTWLPRINFNEAFIKNSNGKTVGYIMEDETGQGTVDCKIQMPPHITVGNTVGRYPDAMATSGSAKVPKWVEHIKTISGLLDYEGVV